MAGRSKSFQPLVSSISQRRLHPSTTIVLPSSSNPQRPSTSGPQRPTPPPSLSDDGVDVGVKVDLDTRAFPHLINLLSHPNEKVD
ncbi:hypothetical protein L6452_14903 [Arctium lappa]|uniref:Uncharacterized protein n=1 Tax=Arctium lappa TaxID=4217 RepID=A0ACB9CMB7_ARCLA|nr:hypothetical protein L6452_14903 [Arctium lappa]